jgi:hypothetical protein
MAFEHLTGESISPAPDSKINFNINELPFLGLWFQKLFSRLRPRRSAAENLRRANQTRRQDCEWGGGDQLGTI